MNDKQKAKLYKLIASVKHTISSIQFTYLPNGTIEVRFFGENNLLYGVGYICK
jgi:hypothetical protein